jgi:hypothetical protein
MNRRLASSVVAALIGGCLVALSAGPAQAEPATTVAYSGGGSATLYQGLAFDTCSAPPLSTIQAWAASPYRAVGVYFGGPNRACMQPNLTAGWVQSVTGLRWRLVPIYMGLQAPCYTGMKTRITPSQAAAQGTASATDAVTAAGALGMLRGSALYADMENYDGTNVACRNAVLQYLSAMTKELHRRGYMSGVYANLSSGAANLSSAFGSTAYARPDALWIARWDLSSSLTGWAGVPDYRWAVHQRGKQYRGDHTETYGGVTLNIDNDRFDAPVATVAYQYLVTSSTPLNSRTGPSSTYPVVSAHASGSTLNVVCQSSGQKVGTTTVWDRLTDGSWVTDYYVSTGNKTSYSAPLPHCFYPYQVLPTSGLNKRATPSSSGTITGNLPFGSLAWVYCQRAGSKVGTTSVWDRLEGNSYVSDLYVATPSKTTYSGPMQRC